MKGEDEFFFFFLTRYSPFPFPQDVCADTERANICRTYAGLRGAPSLLLDELEDALCQALVHTRCRAVLTVRAFF